MATNEDRVRDLAERVAAYVAAQRVTATPRPRLIIPEHARLPSRFDEPTRELHRRRIRFLASRYGLFWVIDQAVLAVGSLEDLPDDQLLDLQKDIERARECVVDGVSFDDVGLVRSRA